MKKLSPEEMRQWRLNQPKITFEQAKEQVQRSLCEQPPMFSLEDLYNQKGWDAVQEFYDGLKREEGTVPYEYFRQYHALARKIQLEGQGPITDESIARIANSRTCLCHWENKKIIICKMCKNK